MFYVFHNSYATCITMFSYVRLHIQNAIYDLGMVQIVQLGKILSLHLVKCYEEALLVKCYDEILGFRSLMTIRCRNIYYLSKFQNKIKFGNPEKWEPYEYVIFSPFTLQAF